MADILRNHNLPFMSTIPEKGHSRRQEIIRELERNHSLPSMPTIPKKCKQSQLVDGFDLYVYDEDGPVFRATLHSTLPRVGEVIKYENQDFKIRNIVNIYEKNSQVSVEVYADKQTKGAYFMKLR